MGNKIQIDDAFTNEVYKEAHRRWTMSEGYNSSVALYDHAKYGELVVKKMYFPVNACRAAIPVNDKHRVIYLAVFLFRNCPCQYYLFLFCFNGKRFKNRRRRFCMVS